MGLSFDDNSQPVERAIGWGGAEPRAEQDIFRVTRVDGEWGRARNLGLPINTEASESSVSVAKDGSLFFSSYRGLDPEQLHGKTCRELLDLYRRPANGYATLYGIEAIRPIPTRP